MVTTLLLCDSRSALCRYYGDQDIRLLLGADVQCRPAAEDRNGAIAWIVVQKRPTAAQLVLDVRQLRSDGFAPSAIAPAPCQRKLLPRRYTERRRPELDIARHDCA